MRRGALPQGAFFLFSFFCFGSRRGRGGGGGAGVGPLPRARLDSAKSSESYRLFSPRFPFSHGKALDCRQRGRGPTLRNDQRMLLLSVFGRSEANAERRFFLGVFPSARLLTRLPLKRLPLQRNVTAA